MPAPSVPLQPAWVLGFDAGVEAAFDGVLDQDGNLYWLMSSDNWRSDFALGSASFDGALRYEVRIPPGSSGGQFSLENEIAIADGLVLVAFGTQVDAYWRLDGGLAWQTPPFVGLDGGPLQPWSFVGTVPGQVVIGLTSNFNYNSYVALDLDGGSALWTFAPVGFSEQSTFMVADSDVAGEVLVSESPTPFPSSSYSLDTLSSAGLLEATEGVPGWSPAGNANGVVYLASLAIGTSAGALVYSDGGSVTIGPAGRFGWASSLIFEAPVFDAAGGYQAVSSLCLGGEDAGPCGVDGLVRFDLSGTVQWFLPSVVPVVPLLMDDESLLALTDLVVTQGSGPEAISVDPGGNVRWACELMAQPLGYVAGDQSSLQNGRLFTQPELGLKGDPIQAYDLPGLEAASHGWITNAGSPAATHQEQ